MYVDAYVMAVPRDALDRYFETARNSAALWLKHGALSVTECRGDDVPLGKLTSFPRAVMATEDEVIVFSTVTYTDRTHRDAVNVLVAADPDMMTAMQDAPVDGARMIIGGFEVVVSA